MTAVGTVETRAVGSQQAQGGLQKATAGRSLTRNGRGLAHLQRGAGQAPRGNRAVDSAQALRLTTDAEAGSEKPPSILSQETILEDRDPSTERGSAVQGYTGQEMHGVLPPRSS